MDGEATCDSACIMKVLKLFRVQYPEDIVIDFTRDGSRVIPPLGLPILYS